jgi:hypothetical protein
MKPQTLNDIECVVRKILYCSESEAKLLRYETCYRQVYNFCINNRNNIKILIQLMENIKKKIIIPNLEILKHRNMIMLKDVMLYYTKEYNKIMNIEENDTLYFLNILIKTNELVIERRKLIRRYLSLLYNKQIPEDLNNIIFQYI